MLTYEGYGTASWLEILWVLAAIPGLVLWFQSYLSARETLRATRHLKEGNGRLLWARFSVELTTLMLLIEIVFIVVGGIVISRPSNPSANLLSTIIISFAFIGASILISFMAKRWKTVEHEILTAAKLRRAEIADLENRSDELEAKAVAQNTRDTDQNIRTFKQDERDREAEL